MNEDSGGGPLSPADDPRLHLSVDEEAELLAIYGTQGPLDSRIDWAAPSLFRSNLGDGHVFLTGAGSDEAAGAADLTGEVVLGTTAGKPCRREPGQPSYSDPLVLYLLKNAPSLVLPTRDTPASFAQPICTTIHTLESAAQRERGPRSVAEKSMVNTADGTDYGAVLRAGQEWEKRARLAVQGFTPATVAAQLLSSDREGGKREGARGTVDQEETASDAEVDRLIHTADALLCDADNTLQSRSFRGDLEADRRIQGLQRQMDRQAIDPLDLFWGTEEVLKMDEEAEETERLLRNAQAARERLRAVLMEVHASETVENLSTGQEVLPTAREKADVISVGRSLPGSSLSSSLFVSPHLYAYDIELPEELLRQHSKPMESTFALANPDPGGLMQVDAVSVYSVEHLLQRSAIILKALHEKPLHVAESVPTIEARRASPHSSPAMTSASSMSEQCPPSTSIEKEARRLVTLPAFIERLDAILSPTAAEQRERKRQQQQEGKPMGPPRDRDVVKSSGKAGGDLTYAHPSSKAMDATANVTQLSSKDVGREETAVSLERIRRAAARENFLLEREAQEARQMRREEDAVLRCIRATEDLMESLADQLCYLEMESVKEKAALSDEETDAFTELVVAAATDAALANEVAQLRRLQEAEQLSYTLRRECEVHLEQLTQEETWIFQRLLRDAAASHQQALTAAAQRETKEQAAAFRMLEGLQIAFGAYCTELRRSGSVTTTYLPDEGRGTSAAEAMLNSDFYRWRMSPLVAEHAHVREWLQRHRRQLERVAALLNVAASNRRQHMRVSRDEAPQPADRERILFVPSAPPTLERQVASADGRPSPALVLTPDSLLCLLWSCFHAVVSQPAQASAALARLPLALESIDAVDWEALQSLVLAEGHKLDSSGRAACVPLTRLVRDLDLSDNPLSSVDLLDVVRTFPSLQFLKLSHTALQRLDCAPGSGLVSTPGSSDVTSSLVGGGSSPLASGLRNRSSPRSSSASAHLRHISAARHNAIAAQVHLASVDVSANKLLSLEPLGLMAPKSLIRCTATGNQLTSLDAVAACTQLRSLSVAHNQLTSLRVLQNLSLLRDLDVRSNQIARLDEADGVAADAAGEEGNTVCLLSTLYASHNRLRSLPSAPHVYPCLTHLFVNGNVLSSLSADSLAWFPLLRVLHAEVNRIADVSGLQRCLRLEELNLADNQLADVESLLPLASCRSLRRLDLRGNPVLSSGAARELEKVRHCVLSLVPTLEEWNNAPLTETEKFWVKSNSSCSGADSLTPSSLAPSYPTCVQGNDLTYVYKCVSSGLCWDMAVRHLQATHEASDASSLRRLNHAKGWAATVLEGCRVSPTNGAAIAVGTHRGLSSAQNDVRQAEDQLEQQRTRVDADTVAGWLALLGDVHSRAAPSSSSLTATTLSICTESLYNQHQRHVAYTDWQQTHLEKLARAYMAEWMLSRVLVRRAQRELRELKAAYRRSETFRREMAARHIQPLWRGAALRSRLHRLLHSHDGADLNDEDEDGLYAKVDVNEWMTADAVALAPVETLMREVVRSLREVALVPFQVKAPVAVATLGKEENYGTLIPGTERPVPPFLPSPPSSQVSRRPYTGASTVSGRPQPHLTPPKMSSAASTPGLPAVSSLEAEWGPTVAAQIRKKQQKAARTTQERRRKEFLQNPLQVQQEMHVTKLESFTGNRDRREGPGRLTSPLTPGSPPTPGLQPTAVYFSPTSTGTATTNSTLFFGAHAPPPSQHLQQRRVSPRSVNPRAYDGSAEPLGASEPEDSGATGKPPSSCTASGAAAISAASGKGGGTLRHTLWRWRAWVRGLQQSVKGKSQRNTPTTATMRGRGASRRLSALMRMKAGHRAITPLDDATAGQFPDNLVINSRYTLRNFLFKNLAEQFSRPLNFYFLLVAMLQFISVIAPVNPLSTLLPLLFAFSLTAVKEGYDDVKRHRQDFAYNNCTRTALNKITQSWVQVRNADICVGDVLLLSEDEEIPCDVVAIGATGDVYIRTDNLDGEIDLKPKELVQWSTVAPGGRTRQMHTLCALPTDMEGPPPAAEVAEAMARLSLDCPKCSAVMESFNARADVEAGTSHHNTASGEHDKIRVPLSHHHLLTQSCVLKNVEQVVCVAVYTGDDTKCGMNKRPPPVKWAQIDKDVSRYSIYIFIGQMINAFGFGFLGYQVNRSVHDTAWYLPRPASESSAAAVIYPLRFFLLTTVMIPVSFKFVVDVCKYYMANTVEWDLSMRHPSAEARPRSTSINSLQRVLDTAGDNAGCKVKNSGILEDLGQIDYVLSDKTGTLTQNVMVLDGVTVCPGYHLPVARLAAGCDTVPEEWVAGEAAALRAVRLFARMVALCNTVEVVHPHRHGEQSSHEVGHDDAHPVYHAASPDEIALCSGVRKLGVSLVARTERIATLQVHHSATLASLGPPIAAGHADTESWTLHHTFGFSSEKKTMGVIAEEPGTGRIWFVVKGADDRVLTMAGAASPTKFNTSNFPLNPECAAKLAFYAHHGLRTLLVARKELSRDELGTFLTELADANCLTEGRQARLDELRAQMESGVVILGITAIEDKLQDAVQETIGDMLLAGIKVWMLTGDKMETAEQIGLSCGLYYNGDTVIRIGEGCTVPVVGALNLSASQCEETDDEDWRHALLSFPLERLPHSPSEQHRGSTSGLYPRILAATSPSAKKTAARAEAAMRLCGMELQSRVRRFDPNDPAQVSNVGLQRLVRADEEETADVRTTTTESGIQATPSRSPRMMAAGQASSLHHQQCSHATTDGSTFVESVAVDPGAVLIVQGGIVLQEILNEPMLRERFAQLSARCRSVICARTTPSQKAAITHFVRQRGAMTLAVGDGGNDVAMLQEAHVGVGISGKEGQQAARAADFSITQFADLRALLFVHGQQAYTRTAYVIKYSFYKSMLISFIQLAYNVVGTHASGGTFWNSFSLTMWNGFYTLPQTVFYCFDRCAPRVVLERNPYLYKMTRKAVDIHPAEFFVSFVLRGVLQSILLLWLCTKMYGVDFAYADTGGTASNDVTFSVAYTALMLSQLFTVWWESHAVTPLNLLMLVGMPVFYIYSTLAYSDKPALQYHGVFRKSLDTVGILAAFGAATALVMPALIYLTVLTTLQPNPRDVLRRSEMQRQRSLLASADFRRLQSCVVRWWHTMPEAPSMMCSRAYVALVYGSREERANLV